MAEPTWQDIFGDNCDYLPNTGQLMISLQDFELRGVPNSDEIATPEAAFFALLLMAGQRLTEMSRANDRLSRSVTLTLSPFDVLEDPVGSGLFYRRDFITAIAYTPFPSSPLNLGAL